MTEPVYTAVMPAYSHGGRFRADPPAFHVIHSTEGPMSPGNAKALAGPAWFGGPKAGTSATDIFDPIDGVKMLDEHTVPYHVGPNGNGLSTGSEHCGSVNLTQAQWLSANGRAMLDRSARRSAQRAHERGWSLADCRWLSVAEVARKTVKGFCTHNDIRLALGGTTHSDPGQNFPYAWYMERVRFWYANPNGDGDEMQEADWARLEGMIFRYHLAAQSGKGNTEVPSTIAAQLKPSSNAQIYELLAYGDSRDDSKDPNGHPNNIQRVRLEMLQDRATLNAMFEIVKQLAANAGSPIDLDEIKATVKQTVEEGLASLDLRITAAPDDTPEPTP